MAKKPNVSEPIAPISQLSADDTAYLMALNRQMQAAQAAMNSFSNYLAGRYQLAEGDSVTPDGQIVRKKA